MDDGRGKRVKLDPYRVQGVAMTPRLRESFRHALVAWNHCEAGAPAIHPSTPLDLRGAGNTRGAAALEVMIRFGEIVPGPRSFPNELAKAGPLDRYDHGIPDPWWRRDTIEIDVTPDHIKVLRCLGYDENAPDLAPGIDPKRPLGDREPAVDVWELLSGRRWTGKGCTGLKRAEGIYLDMAATMQVLFREAELPLGLYGGTPALGNWRYVSPIDASWPSEGHI